MRQRRQLRYDSLDAVLADAEQLAGRPHETVGRWSFGQILCHLAETMNGSIDGYGFRVSWILRTIGPLVKRRVLTRPMPAGIRLRGSSQRLLPSDGVSTEAGLERIRAAVARLKSERPATAHPVLGPLTPEEWTQLHLRHSELHMSFVRPLDQG